MYPCMLCVALLRGDPGLEIFFFILLANICHHICREASEARAHTSK